jgi:hypothetical protein
MMVLILFNNHLLVEFGSGAADAKLIKELSESEFVVVVETKYKGLVTVILIKFLV